MLIAVVNYHNPWLGRFFLQVMAPLLISLSFGNPWVMGTS